MSLRLVFGFGEGRDAYQEQQAGTIGRKPPRAKGCFMMSYSIPTWFGCRVYVTHLGMEQNFRRNRGPGVFRIFSLSHHLLGGLEPWNFMTFHSVGNVRIPTDEVHHFSGGWLKPPTSHCFFEVSLGFTRDRWCLHTGSSVTLMTAPWHVQVR
jgi:hypothetical protein